MAGEKRVAASLLASLLLHALAFVIAMPSWVDYREARLFRARLSYQPRYVPPVSHRVPPERETATELTYVPSLKQPELVPADERGYVPAPVDTVPRAATSLSTYEPAQRPPAGFAVARADTTGPQVAGDTPLARQDMQRRMDLLRLSDIARAGADRSAIITDPTTRRGIRGFVHLSELRMDGIRDGELGVPRLARYVSTVTDMHAQIEGSFVSSFHQAQLQRTPILFVFPGDWGRLQPYLSPDEV